MTFLNYDFLEKSSLLMKEAFTFKKYRAMHPAVAVFSGIAMIPFVLLSFLVYAYLIVLSFLFKTLLTPIDFIHTLVNKEGKDVKHATQFIIYFISWPLVFFAYTLASIGMLYFSLLYAVCSILTYIWSFGGFRFHVFANDAEDISITDGGKYSLALSLVFAIIAPVLFILLFFIPEVPGIILWVYLLFTTLYSLIGLAPRPKADSGEQIKHEVEYEPDHESFDLGETLPEDLSDEI